MNLKEKNIYFNDPRINMTVGGRFFIRTITTAGYWIFVALALAFLISDVSVLRWLSIFLLFFVFSSLLYRERADNSLKSLPDEGKINAAKYFSPPAWSAIERALDRHIIGGEDFHLCLLKNIFARNEMKIALLNTKIGKHEIDAKLNDYLREDMTIGLSKNSAKEEIGKLAIASFYEAMRTSSNYVEPAHIFLAIKKLKSSEYSERLLNLFYFEDEVVRRVA